MASKEKTQASLSGPKTEKPEKAKHSKPIATPGHQKFPSMLLVSTLSAAVVLLGGDEALRGHSRGEANMLCAAAGSPLGV